jgi:hypothetical protein
LPLPGWKKGNSGKVNFVIRKVCRCDYETARLKTFASKSWRKKWREKVFLKRTKSLFVASTPKTFPIEIELWNQHLSNFQANVFQAFLPPAPNVSLSPKSTEFWSQSYDRKVHTTTAL